MRVLVTGGAGYIGAHAVRRLLEGGHESVVVDDLSRGRPESAAGARLVVGDCGDESLLERLLAGERFEAVMHFAALKSVEESVRDPLRYFDHNVARTVTLLRAMERAGVSRFVYSSSAAVYGAPDELPVREDAPLRPMNPYGETKRVVELMLRWLHQRGLRVAVLRYFNAAGASEDGTIGENWTDATNLIPIVMKAALGHGPPVRIFGTDYPTPDGTAVRDYVHVVDLADAHVRALEHLDREPAQLVLNLGTGRGSSVLEVLRATERAAGRPIPVEYGPRRPGDMPAIWADSSLAARLIGWESRRGLAEIVETAWRWHASQVAAGEAPAGAVAR